MDSQNIPINSSTFSGEWITTFGNRIATVGLLLYSVFAPHSIAGGEISLAIAASGWLIRTAASGKTGFRHTKFDLPILLFFLWTAMSSFVSEEPRISIAKIQSTCVIFLFYLTQVIVTRRTAIWLVAVMILSGAAGTAYSLYDLARGRGVVVESLTGDSPLRANILPGDAVWRVNGKRVYSVADVDAVLRNAGADSSISLSVISHGEHVERRDIRLSEEAKRLPSPSGITGNQASHRFRASGWT
ncbi:MAG TPA: PDZ domain-containing protein, partial [Pyrinomonadaceae bacterium]|nr:PDZ domain-containing protein [Pyrinomonadaceae bacterium]